MLRIIVTSAAVIFAALSGGIAMAQTDQDREARNKALVEEKFEAWATGTGSPYELLADDATWTITGNSLAAKTLAAGTRSSARSSGRSTRA
jgi:ketosteroid isomerase-like protein